MCLACAAVAAPEVAVIVGGYAAVRFGRPVSRLRDALGRGREAEQDAAAPDLDEAAGPDVGPGGDGARAGAPEMLTTSARP